MKFPPRFRPDDRFLAFCSGRSTIGVWEVLPGRLCRRLVGARKNDRPIVGLDFNATGTLLASASVDGLRLWDVETATEVRFIPHNGTRSVCFARDNHNLLSCGSAGRYRWPLQPGPATHEWIEPGCPLLPKIGNAVYMAFSRDGRVCAIADWGQAAHILHAGPPAREVVVRHANLSYLAVSPDGRWVATATYQGEGVKLWDAETGRQEHELPMGQARVAFSPDGRWLVAGAEQVYRSWQVGTWQPGPLRLPRNLAARAGPLAFGSDKLLALAPTPRQVRLVEIATGRELATLTAPHPELIEWMCFSPDGHCLAVAYGNDLIHLWNLQQLRARLAEMGLDWSDP
jgi:WD40 repeat protein